MSSFPKSMEADENGKKPALRPRRRLDRHKEEYIKELWERKKGRAKNLRERANPKLRDLENSC